MNDFGLTAAEQKMIRDVLRRHALNTDSQRDRDDGGESFRDSRHSQ